MTDTPVIHTHALSKSYGSVQAVRGLNLSVGAGRITGFLGRNGAGKSTTIKMLLGMMRPSAGEGTVLGMRIGDPNESVELRRRVAYVSEDKRLYNYMTVEQMARFTSSFFPDWRPEVAQQLLREYELPHNRKIKALSKGMRTKLALLLALARRPELLILDEPSEGLDMSLDDMREKYRQIDLVFPALPAEREFQIAGVESIRAKGHQLSVFSSGNTEAIVERARDFHASSIQVVPVGLREIFLEKVKEN
jgi:ABC-2 type transport system ATP-binding protein